MNRHGNFSLISNELNVEFWLDASIRQKNLKEPRVIWTILLGFKTKENDSINKSAISLGWSSRTTQGQPWTCQIGRSDGEKTEGKAKDLERQQVQSTAPDGGWGWAVVAASFAAHVIADGCGFSFGVLFGELLEVFGESKATTAWVGSLFVSVPAICGPIASAVTNSYGCRATTIAGGLIAAFGCFAASFANSIGELCFSFGIVSGFGLSMVFVPAVVVVAFYFEKKRAFATGR